MSNNSNFPEFIVDSFSKEGSSVYSTQLTALAAIYVLLIILIYIYRHYGRKEDFLDFIRKVLIPPTIAGGLMIYFIGYHVNHPHDDFTYKILLSMFSTARLFILGNDLIEVTENVNAVYKLWFSIFSVSAALISTSLLVNLFGKKIKAKLQILFNRSAENYIFFGINEAGITLAKDILRKNSSAFIVFVQNLYKDEDKSLLPSLSQSKILLIDKDSLMDSFELKHEEFLFHARENNHHNSQHETNHGLSFKNMGLHRKIKNRPTHLFLLSESEDQNIHLSQVFVHELKQQNIKQTAHIHIRTLTKDREEILDSWLRNEDKNIVIHQHNQSTIAATQLVTVNLPIDWLLQIPQAVNTQTAMVNKDFTVMFIGFGMIGNAALRKFFEQGQFIGSQFKAIVVDQNMSAQKGRFIHRYPGIMDTLQDNIEFHEMKIGGVEFYELLKKNSSVVDYYVVGLGSDELNVQIAHDIKHVMNTTDSRYKIFVQVINNNYYRSLNVSGDTTIQVFGRDCDVFTESIILKRNMEKMARKIHGAYAENAPDYKRDSWDDLSKLTQESNISVAEHIHTKLRLVGYSIEDIKQFENYEQFEKSLGEIRMQNLAKTEHLRWNAFHFVNGWKKWDLKDIPKEYILNKSNKNEERKLHACLVSWDELVDVSSAFNNEDYYLYDLACMKDIFRNIKEGLYEE
jgi:hypothetical protein